MPVGTDGRDRGRGPRLASVLALALALAATGCGGEDVEPEPIAPTEDGAAAPPLGPTGADELDLVDPPRTSASASDDADDGGVDDDGAPGTDAVAPSSDVAPGPSDDLPGGPVREPEPFEEDTALGRSFGEEDPFAEGQDYDCLTDEDLANVEENLGAEARAEVEALIEAGELDAC